MRLYRYSSFVLVILLTTASLNEAPGQQPKNIVYRAKAKSSAEREVGLENTVLRENLTWSFGGKMQRGWQLYWPLITALIGCEEGADNETFAAALANWQRSADLPASGVLEQESWMKMVEFWQASRSKDRTIPGPERLLTVAASDFYDPERPAELRQVEQQAYAAYKRMVNAAAKDLGLATDANGDLAPGEKFLKIISSYRSPEYQRALRAQSPNSGRAGLAVNSPHFTGRALDLYVGGEPVSTKDANRALQVNTKVYRWLVKNAGKFGFIPYFYEPWHWEYNPQASPQAKAADK